MSIFLPVLLGQCLKTEKSSSNLQFKKEEIVYKELHQAQSLL